MERTPFEQAVQQVRAEQFLREKSASAVPAVAVVNLARAGQAADPELLKLAASFAPSAPLALYEKLGGQFKGPSKT